MLCTRPLVSAVVAVQPQEPEVGITAAHEALEQIEGARGERSVEAGEAVVVDEAKLVEELADERLQRGCGRAGAVARRTEGVKGVRHRREVRPVA